MHFLIAKEKLFFHVLTVPLILFLNLDGLAAHQGFDLVRTLDCLVPGTGLVAEEICLPNDLAELRSSWSAKTLCTGV